MEQHSPVDILIFTALSEELEALKPHFNLESYPKFLNTSIPCYFDRNFVCSEVDAKYQVALVCLNGMGNTNAAVDATNAIHDLKPTYVFMFGIAGGVKDEVELADVIIPDNIFYIGLGKYRSAGLETRPETLRVDQLLLQRLRAHHTYIRKTISYGVKIGPFAVGEQVIANNAEVSKLRELHPKLLGIEMESYGVGLAVHKYRKASFVAVRGVSDYADEQKDDNHRIHALENAAHFLAGFLHTGQLPHRDSQKDPVSKFLAIQHLSMFAQPSIHQAIQTYLTRLNQYDLIEFPIDHTDSFSDGSFIEPASALTEIENTLERFSKVLRENPNSELGYFGLAHVPFVVYAGYKINRTNIRVFGNNYDSGQWENLPDTGLLRDFVTDGVPNQNDNSEGDVILLMSLTRQIHLLEIAGVSENPLATIHIRAVNPRRGFINNMLTLETLTTAFREVLDEIGDHFPQVHHIHLLLAGQPTIAFRCGQQISPTHDPEVIVWNYSRQDKPRYKWGLNLKTKQVIERI